jgi:hypothetical protein
MPAGATYEPIATTTLGSTAANITFSSISSAYTDLRLVFVGTSSAAANFRMRLNSDTASNYSLTYINGDGATAVSNRASSQTFLTINDGGNTLSTTVPHLYTVDFFSYAGSTNKTFLCESSEDDNGSGSTNRKVGLWRNTAAISTILLYPSTGNFNTGTTATIYGIAAA